mmetsp:Transcript_16956/g.35181  ORF Transcript_16956/g.35181 Transcript_16956/m.35181 type:complete len:245 (+) Transcript_16956:2194-2928(+)
MKIRRWKEEASRKKAWEVYTQSTLIAKSLRRFQDCLCLAPSLSWITDDLLLILWKFVEAGMIGLESRRRIRRFMEKLAEEHPGPALRIARSNIELAMASQWKRSPWLIQALVDNADHPFICLIAGIELLLRALTKFSKARQRLIIRAFTCFSKYRCARIADASAQPSLAILEMETRFNIACVFEQIGLPHLAIPIYSDLLSRTNYSGPVEFDLRREAAFNLAHIYRRSGNLEAAIFLLHRHITF